ncbi:MAG: UvrB/UvrC motif-containing protein [bacterium]
MIDLKQKIKDLPQSPGVYYFYDETGKLLYIGKAASLRARVGSYFSLTSPNLSFARRGHGKTQMLVNKIADVKIKETDSVLEALILEANEIKKYLPPFNVRAKDDKTFVNIIITKEEFPRVLVARPTEKMDVSIKKTYGPYTSAKSAREAIKILKKIFPFHSSKEKSEKKCLDFHIGLCPGPYICAITKEDYMKNIRRIDAVLNGKKKGVIRDLEREMKRLAREKKYEEAAGVRDKLLSLKHIQDVSILSVDGIIKEKISNFQFPISKQIQNLNDKDSKHFLSDRIFQIHRIEAYDISNISGKYAVGSMVVFLDGEIAKDEYRRFKIRTVQEANDVGMLKEVLERRFKHTEWHTPDLILIDGGKAQVNAANEILDLTNQEKNWRPIAIGVAKGSTRKKLDLYFGGAALTVPVTIRGALDKKLIAHIMGEAHRFAITYHRLLRKKGQYNPK